MPTPLRKLHRVFATTALVSLVGHEACAQPARPSIVVPFEMRADAVLVTVSVNDSSGLLILDTGSGVSVLDSAFARRVALAMIGPRVTVSGTRNTSMQLGRAKTVRVGAADLGDILIAPVSFSAVQARIGRDVRGSIGYELFTQYVVDIDFDRKVLTLHDPRTFSYHGRGAVLPIRVENRHPVADISIVTRTHGKLSAKMVLDLGSSSYALRFATGFVKAHGLPGDTTTIAGPFGAGVDGVTEGRLMRLPKLEMGPLTFDRPSAALSEVETGAFGSGAQADGTIGMPVFKRTRMIIDYHGSRMIFEPRERLDVPDSVSTNGLTFVSDGEPSAVRVGYVIAGSPGDVAGVRVGDEVIEIDGRSTAAMMVHQATSLMRAAGTVHKLRLRRDARTLDVSITPRMVF